MKPILIVTAAVAGTLALVVGLAFMYGTPQAPDPAAYAVGSGAAPRPATIGGAEMVVGAEVEADQGDGGVPVTESADVPKADPSVPLAIEIPGCTCHSDDPKVVDEHSKYRMNQCAACHAGETPTGQELAQ